jgi:hypothetical protein
MSGALDTPVTVILFNRPDRVRDLIDVLRVVRPRHVLVVADGPRDGHPTDVDSCAAAREAISGIDWSCQVEHEFAESNLGCDRRVQTGLAWVFSRVDRTIILEDDVLPSIDFFAWMERMLDAHAADEKVAMVSGHNPLARWGSEGCDHLRTVRGSVWGWATWSRAWRQVESVDLSGDPASADGDIGRLVSDPVLAEHLAIYLESWRKGELAAWDIVWGLKRTLAGMCAVVSPANLVRNMGLGAGATRTHQVHAMAADLPVFPASMHGVQRAASAEEARALDRASVLLELLGSCVNPAMASRLAQSVHAGAALPMDRRMRHHLLPFRHAAESLAALDHLVAAGLGPHGIEGLHDALYRSIRVEGAP